MKKTINIPIVFLVSRGRSGSTLLQSILDAHPNICAPLESKFALHLNNKYRKTTDWNKKTINEFITDVYSNRKFRLFWGVNPEELRTLFSNYEINSFSDACKIVYLSHHSMFDKDDIKLIIDKNPFHSRFVTDLLNIFPEAKFIHLIRDPRAVTYSHIKSLNHININLALATTEWLYLNNLIEGVKLKSPDIFYEIKYEHFIANPKEELIKLFHNLNLPFLPELLSANATIENKYQSNKFFCCAAPFLSLFFFKIWTFFRLILQGCINFVLFRIILININIIFTFFDF